MGPRRKARVGTSTRAWQIGQRIVITSWRKTLRRARGRPRPGGKRPVSRGVLRGRLQDSIAPQQTDQRYRRTGGVRGNAATTSVGHRTPKSLSTWTM